LHDDLGHRNSAPWSITLYQNLDIMKIAIHKDTPIEEIKKAFSATWPHLKLVFFTKPHEVHHGTGAKFMIDDDTQTVGQIVPTFAADGELLVAAGTTVWQLEQQLEKEFGLHVHVFRRSGETWLQSTVSDDLTLAQQEARGTASDQQSIYIPDPIDYREQD
jgi:hypothetical protein